MVEGAPHTAKGSMINLCVLGCPPAPVYKGARGEAAGLGGGRAKGEFYSHREEDYSFPCWSRRRGKEEERRNEKGAAPLVQFGPEGGCAPPSFWPLSSIPVWPNKAHILPGEFP